MNKFYSLLTTFILSLSSIAQTTHQVLVTNMSYTPSELLIEVGDQVTFILEDGMHDVNFGISILTGEPFDNPVEISSIPMQSNPGEMGTITFDVAGTYNYDCSNYNHAYMGMVGSIIVSHPELDIDIIGNWTVDSTYASVTFMLSQEEIDQLMFMVATELISPQDFIEEMGFPMPTSEEEWESIANNGITVPIPEEELDISGFLFSENQMGLFAQGMISLNYSWSSDSTISIESFSDFPFTEFIIISSTTNNLIMLSSATITEVDDEGEEIEYTYNIIFYCSSVEELILGCTDTIAVNYNIDANVDDGSCNYPYPCSSNELLLVLEDDASDGWEGSQLVVNGISYTLPDGDYIEYCIENVSCFTFYTIEGEFMDEASWEIVNVNEEIIYEGGLPFDSSDIEDPCLDIEEMKQESNLLIKVIDIFGREQSLDKKGILLFYLYSNGNVVKKINL